MISDYQANIVCWTAVGVAIVLTAARLYARRVGPRGYYWDDLAHVVALACLIIQVSVFRVAVSMSSEIAAYEKTKTGPAPDYATFQRMLLVWRTMVWTCVWAVKLGYLLLYRMIFGNYSKNFVRAWWAALIFTILTYIIAFIPVFVYCGSSVGDILNEDVCDAPAADHLQYVYTVYGAVLNSLTTVTIMILPLAVLRRMSLSRLQKFGLGVIFSLSCIELVTDIARIVNANPEVSSEPVNFLLATMESSVAVWISCVPALHYLTRQGNDGTRSRTWFGKSKKKTYSSLGNDPAGTHGSARRGTYIGATKGSVSVRAGSLCISPRPWAITKTQEVIVQSSSRKSSDEYILDHMKPLPVLPRSKSSSGMHIASSDASFEQKSADTVV